METRSAKKKKRQEDQFPTKTINDYDGYNDTQFDRITDLPDAVLHHILSFLPIKSIAQTSVFSKRWRYLWQSFPNLDFTTVDNHIDFTSINFANKREKNLNITTDFVSQVLLVRDKSYDIKTLRFRGPSRFSSLNNLIRRAFRYNVQELDIEVATEDCLNLPRCVITSSSLRVFKFKSCQAGFRLPPPSIMKDGFKSLHTLSLSLVILFDTPLLVDLFTDSSFPNLKTLNLDACFGLKHLRVSCRGLMEFSLMKCFQLHGLDVHCGKLEKMRVASCFDSYCDKTWVKIDCPKLRNLVWKNNAVTGTTCFKKSSSLDEASIGFLMLHEDSTSAKLQSLSNLLSGISHTSCLSLESNCIEILSNKHYFSHSLNPFNNIKSLELHTGFNRPNVPGLACLFRAVPCLHTLNLKIINDYMIQRRKWNRDLWEAYTTEDEQYWESEIPNLKSFLNSLNIVRIHGFLECENEVSLAKFFLKHGKALQEMTICTEHCYYRDSLRRQKIRSQMMGFSWASSNAKISFQ
ncbi:hypothetical protein ACFE04_029996 [Oxalis oulophora]